MGQKQLANRKLKIKKEARRERGEQTKKIREIDYYGIIKDGGGGTNSPVFVLHPKVFVLIAVRAHFFLLLNRVSINSNPNCRKIKFRSRSFEI